MLKPDGPAVAGSDVATSRPALPLTDGGLDYRSVAIDFIMRCIKKGYSGWDVFPAIEDELLAHLSVMPDGLHVDGLLAVT